jgi:hypothetical protein
MRVYRLQVFLQKLESEFSIHHGLSKMAKIIFMVMLVTHVVGCMWYMVGRTGGDGCEYDSETGLKVDEDVCEDALNAGWQWRYNLVQRNNTKGEMYITSLYWAFSTLTTVGYGDIRYAQNLPILLLLSTPHTLSFLSAPARCRSRSSRWYGTRMHLRARNTLRASERENSCVQRSNAFAGATCER